MELLLIVELIFTGGDYMKKRTKAILIISSILILCCVFLGIYAYQHQYNANHMGRYLCIEIDQSGWENIGNSNGMEVMTFNLKQPYVISAKGDKVYLKEALRSNQLSIQDLCKYPEKITTNSDDGNHITSYYFENYQIVNDGEKYIIKSLDN